MLRRTLVTVAIMGLVATACGGAQAGRSSATANPYPYDESPTSVIAQAALQDGAGKIVGLVSFSENRLGVKVDVKINGLPAGTHGIHIHAAGKCDPPEFTTAGGHFNPASTKHGLSVPDGPHAGDLPNLEVAADGKGSLLHYGPHLSLNPAASNGVLFGAGTAVVVHAKADDGKTDPSGDSGARIACGVAKRAGG